MSNGQKNGLDKNLLHIKEFSWYIKSVFQAYNF